jgi:hypothetical protein
MDEIGKLEGIGLEFLIFGFLGEKSEKGSSREHTENRVAS